MPATRHTLALAVLAPALGACEGGPAYHAPRPTMPSRFAETAAVPAPASGPTPTDAAADPQALARWWIRFHDPTLDGLISRALDNNWDLKAAVARVREARAEVEVAAGALLPEADASAGYNRARGSKNVVLPLGALGGGSSSPPKSTS